MHDSFRARTEVYRPWEELPESHRHLLIGVAADVIARLSAELYRPLGPALGWPHDAA